MRHTRAISRVVVPVLLGLGFAVAACGSDALPGPTGAAGTSATGSGGAGGQGGSTGAAGTGAPTGQACSDKGPACPTGQVCDLSQPGRCTASTAGGTCIKKPTACDLSYVPVCGCDAKTYGNDCARQAAGAQLDRNGECEGP